MEDDTLRACIRALEHDNYGHGRRLATLQKSILASKPKLGKRTRTRRYDV